MRGGRIRWLRHAIPNAVSRAACLALCAATNLWAATTNSWLQRLEEDWTTEARLRSEAELVSQPVTTRDDAAGGCDGVKNGGWGFHTGHSPEPWWQVDLGATQALSRVVVWNRCEAAERAARLRVRLSDDGRSWRTVYQHGGTVFYGFTDRKPLEVRLTNATARFVRVQLPGTEFLHLDEVEVFGPVATLMPYDSESQAYELIRRGEGSLVASVYSEDPAFIARAAAELADSHGRVHAVSPDVAASQTGHGNVMPMSLHGGPGRAGGGEELGGLRALGFYHRRTAVQASSAALDALAATAVPYKP